MAAIRVFINLETLSVNWEKSRSLCTPLTHARYNGAILMIKLSQCTCFITKRKRDIFASVFFKDSFPLPFKVTF